MLISVLVAVVLAAVLFAGAAYTLGRTPGMSDPQPDMTPTALPDDRPATGTDVHGLRFDVVVRGYRMAQVDETLARLAYDIDVRDTHIQALEDELGRLSQSLRDSVYGKTDEQTEFVASDES